MEENLQQNQKSRQEWLETRHLEELIELCRDNFDVLHRYSNNRWGAWKNIGQVISKQADTPKQAVINFLLALEDERRKTTTKSKEEPARARPVFGITEKT